MASKKLGKYTLAQYDNVGNTVYIDIESLASSEPSEIINSTAHEMYHAFQWYCIKNIDTESDAVKNLSYLSEIRNWKKNFSHYNNGYSDYDMYENQPLEVSAREYAEKETARIIGLIGE